MDHVINNANAYSIQEVSERVVVSDFVDAIVKDPVRAKKIMNRSSYSDEFYGKLAAFSAVTKVTNLNCDGE